MTFRPLLTLLLLLNYLLVVGAGLTARPARVIDRPYAYEHRHDCQLRNTLRIACFDDCNGVQYTVQKKGERMPLQQLLSSMKGLDLHCLPLAMPRAAAPVPAFRLEADRPAFAAAVLPGYRGLVDLPPRRG